MAESAVSFLIEYLGPLLVDEAKLLKGVRGEARRIRDELESMRSFLRDADAREDSNESIKTWVRQVKHAAYETEDILEEFIIRIGQYQQDKTGIFGFMYKTALSIKQLKARHRIGNQIKDMRTRLSDIAKRKDDYNLSRTERVSSLGNSKHGVFDPRLAALFMEESQLVGIDEPRAQLIAWLLNGERRLSTMSVVGMGGLGKTTLVKKVYDSEQVKKHFQTCAWVTVSQTFKNRDLLQNMITQFYEAKQEQAPLGVDAMTEVQLIQMLRDYLQNKSFVIVFDDIWEVDAWRFLSLVLPSQEYGSRVVLSMRRHDVASSCCIGPSDSIYKHQPLNQKMAWSLFCRRAFPVNEGNHCPKELEKVAQSFVKKCRGLPLAIITLGGLLASKDQTYVVWEMMHRSLQSELGSDNQLKSMMEILWLSINDLPYYLKSCFLYLSVFPEDYDISRLMIIKLWKAEGFIEVKEGKTSEEVGDSYLNALISRSLVQVTKWATVLEVRGFRIHDLVREIMISKTKEESLILSSTEENTAVSGTVRRLSIHTTGRPLSCKSSPCLRSLFIFPGTEQSINSTISLAFTGLRLLRVLNIENVQMESLPEVLTRLLHLRFLNLYRMNIKHVPSSVGRLRNLETLILEENLVCELPLNICRLRQLRHLSVTRRSEVNSPTFRQMNGTKVPGGMGNLRSLQELRLVEVESGEVGELGNLTQLRTLGIVKLRRVDGHDLCSSIEKMRHLRTLTVASMLENEEMDLHSLSDPPQTLQRIILYGSLNKLPNWIAALQNLRDLSLVWSRLKDDPLQALGLLSNLVELRIANAYDGEMVCAKEGAYPKLKELYLHHLGRLKKVRVEKGSMHDLERLSVISCKALVEVPHWLSNLTSLRRLFLTDMPGLAKSLESKGEAERVEFIRHIPLVNHYDSQVKRNVEY